MFDKLKPFLFFLLSIKSHVFVAAQVELVTLGQLPDDILLCVLEYDNDLLKTSGVCKKFDSLVKLIYKKRWEELKGQSQVEHIPRILDAIELVYGKEPKYVHFKELYGYMLKQVGPYTTIELKNFDISSSQALLAMDKDIQRLLLIWGDLRAMIVLEQLAGGINVIGYSSSPEQIVQWLNHPGNLPVVHKALRCAALNGCTETVNILCKVPGVDPNTICECCGHTLLMNAALSGSKDIVKSLCEAGADVNAYSKNYDTAIFFAIGSTVPSVIVESGTFSYGIYGHADIVDVLLEYGAAVNVVNKHGHTPIMIAAERNLDIVKALLRKGANVPENLTIYDQDVKEVLQQVQLQGSRG